MKTRFVLGHGTVLALLTAGVRASDTCTGYSTYTDGNGKLKLLCAGQCNSPKTCKSRSGSDEIGSFDFCGCEAGDYDTCCTVIIRHPEEGTPAAVAYGSCTAQGCPGGGPCQISGGSNQPSCPN